MTEPDPNDQNRELIRQLFGREDEAPADSGPGLGNVAPNEGDNPARSEPSPATMRDFIDRLFDSGELPATHPFRD